MRVFRRNQRFSSYLGGLVPRGWRLVASTLVGSMATVAIAVVAEAPAGATTTDTVGLPVPEKLIDVAWGHPLVGRNFVSAVARKARIISGVMDVAGETEGEPEWFYGELELHLYINGKPTTIIESLYPFTYVGNHHVTAGLIPNATISTQHPLGVPNGLVTFTVAKPFAEIKNDSEEPKYTKASLRFKGGGPYTITFKRQNGNGPRPLFCRRQADRQVTMRALRDGRGTRRRARGWGAIAGVLAGAGALLLTAAAFAAPRHEPRRTAAAVPRVTAKTWAVSIAGHTQQVAVGGTVRYSPSTPVESITPEVTLTADSEGKHQYSYRISGPQHTETGVTEGSFTGRSTVVDPAIIPLAMALGPEGKARRQDAKFIPGTYSMEVRVGSTKHVSFYGEGRGKPALVVTLKLVNK